MQPARVMIVDDDQVSSAVVAAVLATHGHEVMQRDQAIGTRAAIALFQPEVVVLDVDMPAMSGPTLMRLLGTRGDHAGPVVILHSSIDPAKLQEIARATGAIGAIPKGDAQQFVVQFERILAHQRRECHVGG